MKNWKNLQVFVFILVSIGLNLSGCILAASLSLPFWLDSFGTVLSACIGGPVCGALTGLTSNLIYSMLSHSPCVYAVISVALGIIVGLAARRHMLDTIFGTMSVSALCALVSILAAVPLNNYYSGGLIGNVWGDGVAAFLQEHGIPKLLGAVAGEFYIEFVDKLLTLTLLYLLMRVVRRYRHGTDTGGESRGEGTADLSAGAVVLVMLLAASCTAGEARAAEAIPPAGEGLSYSDYVQTVYDSSNGLPCGEANDVVWTNDGILWVGTYAGLYRYNGTEFRWMDYESVRNVNCLCVDMEGRLWIGTNDNGLSISIGERIVNVLDESDGLPSNSVKCMAQGADGFYYIGTAGSLQVLALRNGLKKVAAYAEISGARCVASDTEGHVAVVTSNGRLFLMKEGRIMSSLRITESDELFNSCGFDLSGRLLAGTNRDHIYTYDISGEHFQELDTITCEGLLSLNEFYQLPDGDLLVASDSGIGCLGASGDFQVIGIHDFNSSVDHIEVDYQGNFWFTSSRLGLLRLSRSPFRDVYNATGLENRVVNAVAKWGEHYYFGTDRGLDVVDQSCHRTVESELARLLEDVRIRCLYADEAGDFWICTYGQGLWQVKKDGSRVVFNSEDGGPGNKTRLVTGLSDGTIAASGENGLVLIEDGRIRESIAYTEDGIGTTILTLTELKDGTILAGTDGDGIAVLKDGVVTGKITRHEGLSSEVILRTVLDVDGEGVFVVTSNGLCYLDASGEVRVLGNFPYFNNYDLWFRDEDTLFVMSSAGMYVVDREELLSGNEEIHYDLLDGRRGLLRTLTANAWNYSDGDGGYFLCCDSGVYILDTARYRSMIHSYRMMISQVSFDNKPYRLERGNPVLVPHGTGRITLYPEVVNYTVEEPYVGCYLEGFEENWSIVPQRSLSSIAYTNLPAGEYTFHLAVFDNDRETILEERTYPVIREMEIYDRRYFKIYMLLVAMVAVIWFTWFIVRTQVQRTMEVQRRELEVARHKLQMGNETIMAIAKAVDAKDVRTSQHSYRVSEYSYMIGRELGLSEKECINLRNAARMHDIGKIGIPDSILNKPARLTDEEYAVMKSHTVKGAEILKDFTLIDNVVEGAQYHHERYDGKGYPSGLAGEEIPLYGRIIGVADAFDAMTANRVYRRQLDLGYVLEEMKRCSGSQFDPQMVDILLKLINDGKINIHELYPDIHDDSAT